MGKTEIEWCDFSFNPWIGCSKVSPACKHCYAATMANARPALVLGRNHHVVAFDRALKGLPVLPTWGDDAPRRVTSADYWRQPLRWNRRAEKDGVRRRVFCASLADVFEANRAVSGDARGWEDLDDVRQALWDVIEETPLLDWLLLTKRPQNALVSVPGRWHEHHGGWPRNVWIGTTVEDQQRAEERLPHLLRIPARVRLVSYEPALGPVDWRPWLRCPGAHMRCMDPGINWLICGGESGPHARPMRPDWARSAREQCRAAGVPFFFKQWGEWVPPNQLPEDEFQRWDARHNAAGHPGLTQPTRLGKARSGRLLDGVVHDEFPVP